MKKLVLFMIACAFLVASSAQAASSPALVKPTLTLNFLEIQTSAGGTGAQNAAPKPGDRFWFHSEFYKWNGSKQGAHFGHVNAILTFLPSGVGQVTAVAYLPGGTISVMGEEKQARVQTLAVVGGTGAYATSLGEVTIRSVGGENSNMSADTVRLWN